MDVDLQPTMEETILVGDDLMMGPPSPIIPPEIASHVLEGVDMCDGILRNLFLCLQINDIEPFCQDEIALYRQCAEKRALDSGKWSGRHGRISAEMEFAWPPYGYQVMLKHVLAFLGAGMLGIFVAHLSSRRRLEGLKQGLEKRTNEVPVQGSTCKRWFFW